MCLEAVEVNVYISLLLVVLAIGLHNFTTISAEVGLS